MNNHYRRIVCDVDDTISFTSDRDWKNAIPNTPVIEKINYLYDQGWEIYLVTARGQVSCKGDSVKASGKYREVLEKWLDDHSVNYHLLSFEKQLGAYYVDDKALRPDELVELSIKPLTSGRSGALVEKRGNRVYKTHKTQKSALQEANWYSEVSGILPVPKLHSVIDQTVCIDYIQSVDRPIAFDFLKETLLTIKQFPALHRSGSLLEFLKEVEISHRKTIDSLGLQEFFSSIMTDKNILENSLCHGDFTLENIISSEDGFILIDPLIKDSYSSWILDGSKMLMSLRKHGRALLFESFLNFLDSKSPFGYHFWLEMEIVQWIRIYKYLLVSENESVAKMIKELIKEL